jgi:hypothetical protein
MSLPWRPELQQVRTRSGCETLRRRLRVKWHRKSEYAFRTPLWVLGTQPELKTTLFQEGFAISGKEFRSRQSVGLRSRAIWAASLHAGRPGLRNIQPIPVLQTAQTPRGIKAHDAAVSRITRRPDFWSARPLLLSWRGQMISRQQGLSTVTDTTANLHAQFRELIRLRAQVRKAQQSARRRKSRRKRTRV